MNKRPALAWQVSVVGIGDGSILHCHDWPEPTDALPFEHTGPDTCNSGFRKHPA